jgi:hypothetical protein
MVMDNDVVFAESTHESPLGELDLAFMADDTNCIDQQKVNINFELNSSLPYVLDRGYVQK